MLLMSDITKITVIFAAILAVLMLVLIIVTVKVLKSGKDTEDEDKEDVQDTVKKALSDDDNDEQYDDDEDDEPVVEAEEAEAEEYEGTAEAEEGYEDTSADDQYDDEDEDPNSEPTDDISEIQAKLHKVAPEYTTEETVSMDAIVDEVNDREALIDSEFADSAFAPQSVADKLAATVAKADLEKKAEYEARRAKFKADKAAAEGAVLKTAAPAADDVILPKAETEDADIMAAATQRIQEINDETVNNAVGEALNETAPIEEADDVQDPYEAEIPAEEDSAFADSAFGDSAFGVQTEMVEERIHPLPETSQTIPVNPVNAVNIATVNSVDTINTTNESAGISDMNQVRDFLEENPVPKKKKRKIKKKEQEFIKKFGDLEPHFKNGSCYWYNNQDIENLTKKEDMYFYCHYFDQPEDAVMPLIVEMYDCAFVRTEEIQYIAYGVRFKSMNFRQIINTKEHIDFDITTATKSPTEEDRLLIYEKWRGYVDKFMEIIVFNAPDQVREEIIEKMYEYGRNDVDDLMVSPE